MRFRQRTKAHVEHLQQRNQEQETRIEDLQQRNLELEIKLGLQERIAAMLADEMIRFENQASTGRIDSVDEGSDYENKPV